MILFNVFFLFSNKYLSNSNTRIAEIAQDYYIQIAKNFERIRDLSNPSSQTMKIRESKHGVYIEGVTEMYVREGEEVLNLMTMGADNRTVL